MFVIFVFAYLQLAYSYEFPIAQTIMCPPRNIDTYKLHEQMASHVVPSGPKNFFTCCFRFILSNGKKIIVPLNSLRLVNCDTVKIYDSISEFLKSFTDYDEKNLNEYIRDVNPRDSKLNKIGVLDDHFTLVFRSGSEHLEEVYSTFVDLHKQFKKNPKLKTPGTKNQTMQLCAQDARIRDDNGYEIMRYTDSEARAICVLQNSCVIDNIINCVCSKINKINKIKRKVQIKAIEFHGCTTRDMCPLCFTNMNIIQYLCNNPSDDPDDFSFLRYLRDTLTTNEYNDYYTGIIDKTKVYAQKDCTVTTFISSIKEEGDNLNFLTPKPWTEVKPGFVHQFRLPKKPSAVSGRRSGR